jgi:tRNA pseudouridine55 synthase
MGRRKKGQIINGWVNLNKPCGIGSTPALNKVRRALDAQKAGHGGTLDPLASGVLPIALGEATKTVAFAQDATKEYEFTVKWGERTDTDDMEGDIVEVCEKIPSESEILAVLGDFTGEIEQVPPLFSAIKVDGRRAYDLARSGEDVEIKSRKVFVEELELTEHKGSESTFRCVCGKGTYIRSLGRDMAEKMGSLGHISMLKRIRVGKFRLEDAISLDFFDDMSDKARIEELLLPVQTMLDDIPALALNQMEASMIRRGQVLSLVSRPDVERLSKAGIEVGKSDDSPILVTLKGKAVAVAEVNGCNIKPKRVFNL